MMEIYAHRGVHHQERENSVGAFRAAVALGVDGVEFDVRRTLDGALVIHHDPVAEGLSIARTALSELPPYVPTLDQAIDALVGLRINVELKNLLDPSEPVLDETGRCALETVASLQSLANVESIIVSSFDLATCEVVRAADADIAVGWLFWDVAPLDGLETAVAAGLSAIHPHYLLVDAALVARAHDLGLLVNAWTVNRPEDIEAMARFGVSSVITDEPALALKLLR